MGRTLENLSRIENPEYGTARGIMADLNHQLSMATSLVMAATPPHPCIPICPAIEAQPDRSAACTQRQPVALQRGI